MKNKIKEKAAKIKLDKKIFIPLGILAVILVLFISVAAFLRLNSIARVNGRFVSRSDFQHRVNAQIKYQKEMQEIGFDGDEGKKRTEAIEKQVLDQLIEEKVIDAEAEKFGVKVIEADINKEFEAMAGANKTNKLREIISSYGYTETEFKNYNLAPKILRQKVTEKLVSSGELDNSAKSKADEILKQLKSGTKFEDLAKKESQDVSTAAKGGGLGEVDLKSLPGESQKAVIALKDGGVSEVVKTSYGYQILKLNFEKGGKYNLSQILIKQKDFATWVKEKVSQARIKKYI
ncbi:MAG: hypothetical protein UU65_C0002G0299 [candidate division CPR2 bacterium GW2011_GWC1_41_48]|uniref:peptidylprolyl isomerase n=1 Tax=candidate division CPR2 bacterium GW2011_GWC1_41_48 TaxID=1618344 RepID=A0A0G0YIZ2_UNCC2|nr:MAG: hypothetical protein UT47_C0002G0005 [candidate division CPR2 bacterium GW2011_GWC2_39_35]KKR29025.1 MAG: hypothetical protein UT60_C0008G0068 [candidate division CPR2 bacterium GW2011_GWD2_39_7]KKS09521.1 MAG: hypothetical protein UU65_C0002G0299 [candidate division CPR2 bacterium GW2011_GWC1_41_48]OGB70423.1 MAG: hypothetical protein A2Y26_00410 [candidate division CPR2 bacterium GWD2_39_7]